MYYDALIGSFLALQIPICEYISKIQILNPKKKKSRKEWTKQNLKILLLVDSTKTGCHGKKIFDLERFNYEKLMIGPRLVIPGI